MVSGVGSQPTVNLKGYNHSPVENLGSCIVYLYHGNKIYRVLCQVADSKGHMILGRNQALIMEYVSFPEIQKPTVQAKTNKSIKTLVEEPVKCTNGPMIPRVQKFTDPVVTVIQTRTQERITINGKTHSLPTTKDYLLQEYADVFEGIGTLPGGPYRIQLKEGYKPVQHPPRQVAVSLKPPYKAELERLTQLGVIKKYIRSLKQRRDFQALVLVYKCIHNQAPSYIQNLFKIKLCSYNLRGSGTILKMPRCNLEWRHKSFSFIAARTWNSLPPFLREAENLLTFKRLLNDYYK